MTPEKKAAKAYAKRRLGFAAGGALGALPTPKVARKPMPTFEDAVRQRRQYEALSERLKRLRSE